MSARCLSVHAGYHCRHSGACCSGVFPIPAEPHVVEFVSQSRVASRPTQLFVAAPGSDGARFLASGPGGACVFFELEDRLCELHRLGGTGALPTACRHFPRVYLRDTRGVSLTLSHFCPTAATLLLENRPLEIVEAGPPLALDGDVEAFDAAGALPPLLRPGLLTDLAGFDAWERAAVATLAREDLMHDQAIAVMAAATELIRLWKPGTTPLAAFVEESFKVAAEWHVARDRWRDEARLDLVDSAGLAARGCALRRASADAWARLVEPAWPNFDRALKRYLAAKLFANPVAYECPGLRSMVEWIRVCLAVLRNEAARASEDAGVATNDTLFVEAVRASDLTLVHRIDTAALARSLQRIEEQP